MNQPSTASVLLLLLVQVSLDSEAELAIDVAPGLFEPLLHLLLLIQHLPVALLLLMLDLLEHDVLLDACLGQISKMRPHMLPLLDLPDLGRIHAPLQPQLLIVLVHLLLPALVGCLLIRQAVLKHLVYLRFLLRFIHDFLQRLRQSVFLQVILKDLLLSQGRLPYFVEVNLFVVGDKQAVILLQQTILRGRPLHPLII